MYINMYVSVYFTACLFPILHFHIPIFAVSIFTYHYSLIPNSFIFPFSIPKYPYSLIPKLLFSFLCRIFSISFSTFPFEYSYSTITHSFILPFSFPHSHSTIPYISTCIYTYSYSTIPHSILTFLTDCLLDLD